MKIRPLLNRVIIKQDEAQTGTKSGLIFPDNGKQKPLSGKIIAHGDKVQFVKIGDDVLYEKFRGTEIVIEGVEHMIMTENDVLGIVE